jgi:hypothetical protein
MPGSRPRTRFLQAIPLTSEIVPILISLRCRARLLRGLAPREVSCAARLAAAIARSGKLVERVCESLATK